LAKLKERDGEQTNPVSVEEAGLGLHLSLGMSSKVVKVLSKIVGYLNVLVPVCDRCREGIVVFGE
jgi:hypothetical protein